MIVIYGQRDEYSVGILFYLAVIRMKTFLT